MKKIKNKNNKAVFGLLVFTLVITLSFTAYASYESTKEYDGAKISFWSFSLGPQYQDQLKGLMETFENKTGIKVELTMLSWGGGNKKILSAMAAGNAPDVIYTTRSRCLPIVDFGQGAVQPLGKLISDSGLKSEIKYDAALEEYNFYGNQWAVGVIGNPHPMAINVNMFKEAGINPEYIEKMTNPNKVWTWTDLFYLAEKLTKDTDGDGEVDQWGFGYPGGSDRASPVLAMYWNTGGKIVDPKGNVGLKNESTLPLFELLASLKEQGNLIKQVTTFSGDQAESAFLDGKFGISYYFPADRITARKDQGAEVPNIQPVYPPKSPTGHRGQFFAWDGLMMSGSTNNQKAAWELIQFLATGDAYKEILLKNYSYLTPTATNEDISELVQKPYMKSRLRTGLESLKRGWYTRHEPAHTASSEIMRDFNTNIQSVLIGDKTPMEAALELKKTAEKLVKGTN